MTELGEQELGEQLVEAAQILLYRRGTTHTAGFNRHRKPEEMSRC
jgi:hypothetical protein